MVLKYNRNKDFCFAEADKNEECYLGKADLKMENNSFFDTSLKKVTKMVVGKVPCNPNICTFTLNCDPIYNR